MTILNIMGKESDGNGVIRYSFEMDESISNPHEVLTEAIDDYIDYISRTKGLKYGWEDALEHITDDFLEPYGISRCKNNIHLC